MDTCFICEVNRDTRTISTVDICSSCERIIDIKINKRKGVKMKCEHCSNNDTDTIIIVDDIKLFCEKCRKEFLIF